MQVIDQKTGGDDVTAGEVGLELGEIADAENVVVVVADRKLGVDSVVIFAVEGVVEPDSMLDDRAGEGKEWEKLVEAPSVLVLSGRDEVCRPEAEVIVSDAGVEVEQAG